jgi:quinol monooxygenase YgiN
MAAVVFVRFSPKPGQAARVQTILQGMVVATRQEPGCRRYDLFRAPGADSNGAFFLVENYADEAAIQAHRDTAHYKEYRANIMELLERPPEVQILEPLDAKPY